MRGRKNYADGWYDAVGEIVQVRVENNMVVRATKADDPASVYERSPYGGWVNVCPIYYGTFLKRWKNNSLSII